MINMKWILLVSIISHKLINVVGLDPSLVYLDAADCQIWYYLATWIYVAYNITNENSINLTPQDRGWKDWYSDFFDVLFQHDTPRIALDLSFPIAWLSMVVAQILFPDEDNMVVNNEDGNSEDDNLTKWLGFGVFILVRLYFS
jgi:hypothetical protein